MGVACGCEESAQVSADAPLRDLPGVNINSINDPLAKFEASLPFKRTMMPIMSKKIYAAEKACGEEGFVTLQALREELITPAWGDLASPDSVLARTLLSPAFKNEGKNQTTDQIDVKHLMLWSILHCSGSPK